MYPVCPLRLPIFWLLFQHRTAVVLLKEQQISVPLLTGKSALPSFRAPKLRLQNAVASSELRPRERRVVGGFGGGAVVVSLQ